MLGSRLVQFANEKPLVVLALPRGGVPVAFEVAIALHAPLDVFLVRKLGFPGQEELAIGAVATGGARLLNVAIIRSLHLPPEQVEAITERETKELERREHLYRGARSALNIDGQTVILVDDGIATGSSMRVAVTALRQKNPRKLIVAIPVAPFTICEQLRHEVDAVVCLSTPPDFYAVGEWYREFSQISDTTVRESLDRAESQLEQPPS
jgi:putative phosphoribosyl transferase